MFYLLTLPFRLFFCLLFGLIFLPFAILFLPFLLIDMVTAAITTSIGMFQLPPVVVSTPLKILLFVMVDGWNLLAHSLLKSF